MYEVVRGKYGTKKGWFVQVGKGKRGEYITRYSFENEEGNKAIFYYECINIGKGYKKRLIRGGRVIRKAFS